MLQVCKYLNSGDYRHALVRLWILASNPVLLNDWEQKVEAKKFDGLVENFLIQLGRGVVAPPVIDGSQPLALIRAVEQHMDTHTRVRGSVRLTPILEDGQKFWLIPSPLSSRPGGRLSVQFGNLSRWFQRYAVVPERTNCGIVVSVQQSQGLADEALRSAAEASEETPTLRAWIAHFDDGADVQWQRDALTRNWRAASVHPHDHRTTSIEACLHRATEAGAHVLLLPEFSVDLHQRQRIQRWLEADNSNTLALVVPGSFHEAVADEVFNTAPLWNGTGTTICIHRKLRLFGDELNGAEAVSIGNTLNLLVTPVGTFTVLICKDYIDAHESVATLLQEIPVDWALIVSYGNETTLKLHKTKARHLARVAPGTHTIVAHTLNTALEKAGAAALPGFGHVCADEQPIVIGVEGGLVEFKFSRKPSPLVPAASRQPVHD